MHFNIKFAYFNLLAASSTTKIFHEKWEAASGRRRSRRSTRRGEEARLFFHQENVFLSGLDPRNTTKANKFKLKKQSQAPIDRVIPSAASPPPLAPFVSHYVGIRLEHVLASKFYFLLIMTSARCREMGTESQQTASMFGSITRKNYHPTSRSLAGAECIGLARWTSYFKKCRKIWFSARHSRPFRSEMRR